MKTTANIVLPYQTFAKDAMAVGDSFSDVFTLPIGYTRLVGIYFNPFVDFRMDIKSQAAQNSFIMAGVSTLIGNVGYMALGIEGVENSIFSLTFLFKSNPNSVPVPYNFASSLVYAK